MDESSEHRPIAARLSAALLVLALSLAVAACGPSEVLQNAKDDYVRESRQGTAEELAAERSRVDNLRPRIEDVDKSTQDKAQGILNDFYFELIDAESLRYLLTANEITMTTVVDGELDMAVPAAAGTIEKQFEGPSLSTDAAHQEFIFFPESTYTRGADDSCWGLQQTPGTDESDESPEVGTWAPYPVLPALWGSAIGLMEGDRDTLAAEVTADIVFTMLTPDSFFNFDTSELAEIYVPVFFRLEDGVPVSVEVFMADVMEVAETENIRLPADIAKAEPSIDSAAALEDRLYVMHGDVDYSEIGEVDREFTHPGEDETVVISPAVGLYDPEGCPAA